MIRGAYGCPASMKKMQQVNTNERVNLIVKAVWRFRVLLAFSFLSLSSFFSLFSFFFSRIQISKEKKTPVLPPFITKGKEKEGRK